MKKTKAIEPKKRQNMLSSTLNSETSLTSPPCMETSGLTPIPLGKANTAKKTVGQSKSENSEGSSSTSAGSSGKLSIRKKTVDQSKNEKLQKTLDSKYVKYLQCLKADKDMEKKYKETKAEAEAQMADLSKTLQSHRELLAQVNKRLSDVTVTTEMEDIIKLQEKSHEIQSLISLNSIHDVDKKLDEVINSVPTKNVVVPKYSGIGEFQSVLEDTLASLKEINEASTSHGDSYVTAKNDLVKMKSSWEDTQIKIQQFEQQKPIVRSDLLLQSSRAQDTQENIPQVPDFDLGI